MTPEPWVGLLALQRLMVPAGRWIKPPRNRPGCVILHGEGRLDVSRMGTEDRFLPVMPLALLIGDG